MLFRNRREAGQVLASRLSAYKNRPEVLVLALPRGGVPVAYEVAKALHIPMDVFIVRKLGAVEQEEYAIGAIATGGVRVLNEKALHALKISSRQLEAITEREQAELERRERAYRRNRPAPLIRNQTIILVDDGLATGATMRAAAQAIRQQHPAKIVVAVPTAAPEVCDDFRAEVDEVVCALTPEPFFAVGAWYRDFAQTTDDEVRDLLHRAASI